MKQWIVVAGTDSARLFLRTSMTEPIVEIYNLTNEAAGTPRRELVRHSEATKSGRTVKENVCEQFAQKVAKTLNDGSKSSRFDSLVLISEPHFLGKLKSHLKPASLKKLDAVIKRDWRKNDIKAVSDLIEESESISALPIR